jgi:hypothetical protein
MAELLVRFVFEVVLLGLARLGQMIARPVVSLASGGRIFVDPPPNNLIVVRRWHGLHHLTDGTPVIGKTLASVLGLAIGLAACILVLVTLRLVR